MDSISVKFQRSSRFSTILADFFDVIDFFISAAMRSCPAFFIASDRSDPGGKFRAIASASDARASQSCLSLLPVIWFKSWSSPAPHEYGRI